MKFKIGDRVKYIGNPNCCHDARLDIGKIATIVDIPNKGHLIGIYIKDSKNNFGCKESTWTVADSSIIPMEGQLIFDFMYDSE